MPSSLCCSVFDDALLHLYIHRHRDDHLFMTREGRKILLFSYFGGVPAVDFVRFAGMASPLL